MANDRALTSTRLPRSEELGVSTIVENGQLSEQQVAYYVEQFKGCPDEDVKAFFWTVEKYGLNPYGVAQIYGIPRTVKTRDRDGREREEKRLTIQVGINGLVAIAQRTGRYAGMTEPQWCGEDGVWRTFWNRGHFEDVQRGRGSNAYTARVLVIDPPTAARVGVCIRGQAQPSWFIANWIESADFDTKGEPRNLWKTKPALMLAKVAAAGALRRTFQDDFASLQAEFTAEDRPAARISDLYPDEEPERPRLNAGFVAPPDMEDDDEPNPPSGATGPTRPINPDTGLPALGHKAEPAAERQTAGRGDPDAFWKLARHAHGLDDREIASIFGGQSPMAYMRDRPDVTWADMVTEVKKAMEPTPPAAPEPEIVGFDNDGNPIQAPLMDTASGDPVDGARRRR